MEERARGREEGYYYADKSGHAVDLIEAGSYYFLSRPRRFGKSLLLDTFKDLFEGNRSLFLGLAAESRWDWSRRHPVIRISFGSGVSLSGSAATPPVERLAQRIRENLRIHREALGLPRPADLPEDDSSASRPT